jgi:hypothetical protein
MDSNCVTPDPHAKPGTCRARLIVLLFCATLISFLAACQKRNEPSPAASASASGDASDTEVKHEAVAPTPSQPAPPAPTANKLPARGNRAAAPAAGQPGAVTQPLPTSAVYSQQLIQRMAQVDPNQGRITPEQAALLKQQFKDLASQGSVAIPAIRQFLEGNQDVSFEDGTPTPGAGYGSLRAGLFDTLRQIGGPESTDLMLSTLRSTADPSEIATLANYLDEQAPGIYRQEAVNAAHDTLTQALNGQMQLKDAGPLFQTLQKYGDSTVAAELVASMPQWNFYATMALSALPENQGVSSLIQKVQDATANGGSANVFTLQMLAQVAGQSPDAAAALVEQAKQGQIPDRYWSKIVEGLAGDQYQLGKPPTDPNNPGTPVTGLKTYHIEGGNQNFYSLPVNLYATPDQMSQRRAVVDDLLAATQNPAALQQLQNARAVLSAPAPRP